MPIVLSRNFPGRSKLVLTFAAALIITCIPGVVQAQAVYGSISGVVTDASGAVVPGATVTITSVDRKTADVVISNESGYYLKERLVPGSYELKAELQGFKTATYTQIAVSIDTQTRLNVKLEPGALTETVRVEASTPVLKTDRADVATTFEARQITDLPILDRNFTKFILLTPGTQQLMWQHASSENPQGSTQTMVNGQHFSGTGYQLDGTDNRDPVLGIIVINPNFEAIGETKITSQNYDAEFGQATAGVVSVQTRSGTNNLRGSGFEFYQGDRFQSRNPFTQSQADPLTGKLIPATKKNQYGGSVGRPDPEGSRLLLRRLPGDPQRCRRLEAVERSHRSGAQRRSQRLRDQHLRSAQRRDAGAAPPVWQQCHPGRPSVAAGAEHPQADSTAQSSRN